MKIIALIFLVMFNCCSFSSQNDLNNELNNFVNRNLWMASDYLKLKKSPLIQKSYNGPEGVGSWQERKVSHDKLTMVECFNHKGIETFVKINWEYDTGIENFPNLKAALFKGDLISWEGCNRKFSVQATADFSLIIHRFIKCKAIL